MYAQAIGIKLNLVDEKGCSLFRRLRRSLGLKSRSRLVGTGTASDIALVIASFRYGHLAAHAIESALSQTLEFQEIHFVDDGADDCRHLPSIYSCVNFVLRKENLGIVANFQDMLSRVSARRVMFLGADNWLRDDACQLLSAVKADVVTYDITVTGLLRDEILMRHPEEVHAVHGSWYWDRSNGHHGSMVYDVKLAKSVGGYESPPGHTVEDLILYNKLLRAGATRKHLSLPLLYYRRHNENFYKYAMPNAKMAPHDSN